MPRLQTGTFRGFWVHITCKRLGNFRSEILSMYDLYPEYIGGFSCYCLLLPSPTLKSAAAPRCFAAGARHGPLRFRSRARQPQQGTGRMWCLEEKNLTGDLPEFWTWENQTVSLKWQNISWKKRKLIFPNDLCSWTNLNFSGVLNFLSLKPNIAVSKRPWKMKVGRLSFWGGLFCGRRLLLGTWLTGRFHPDRSRHLYGWEVWQLVAMEKLEERAPTSNWPKKAGQRTNWYGPHVPHIPWLIGFHLFQLVEHLEYQ